MTSLVIWILFQWWPWWLWERNRVRNAFHIVATQYKYM